MNISFLEVPLLIQVQLVNVLGNFAGVLFHLLIYLLDETKNLCFLI